MIGPRSSAAPSQAGYTLPEMLVALAIVAAALVIAAPGLQGPSASALLRATAQDAVALARLARGTALRTGRSNELVIDRTTGLYWVSGVAAPRRIPGTIAFDVRLADGRPAEGSRSSIVFTPDGASSGGVLTLASSHQRLRIEVDIMTGSARIR